MYRIYGIYCIFKAFQTLNVSKEPAKVPVIMNNRPKMSHNRRTFNKYAPCGEVLGK